MKPTHVTLRIVLGSLMGAGAIAMLTAFKKGDTVYAKKITTPLLAEPRPLAAASTQVDFGVALAVEEVTGSWLRVTASDASGWVFAGNVADEKPSRVPSAGLTQVSADSTDTTAAARPLAVAAEGYSARHDGAEAQAGVEWLDAQSAAIAEDEIVAYMRENEKGEYRK
jgi:hypothetical protein